MEILYIAMVGFYLYIEIMRWLEVEATIREKAWVESHPPDWEFQPRGRCERFISYIGFNY